jgi:hypothetical protein
MIVYLANKTEFRADIFKGSEQLFASKYRTILPTEAERKLIQTHEMDLRSREPQIIRKRLSEPVDELVFPRVFFKFL